MHNYELFAAPAAAPVPVPVPTENAYAHTTKCDRRRCVDVDPGEIAVAMSIEMRCW